MPQPWTLLALPPLDAALLASLFTDLPVDLVVPSERTPDAVREAAGPAELVLGDWSGALRLPAEVFTAAPRLAFVQQPSVGIDSVDVAACTAAGVPLANAGDVNAVSVAEWCVGATFALLRSLAHGDREVRAGRWPQLELSQRGGGELTGRRVGIIGMGLIGRECAKRFVALGADVAHWSRTQREAADAGGARWLPFDDLLRRSDVLVVVIALAPQTRGLLVAEELSMLPPGAFVVNAARGGIVDETALLDAIRSGALAGAALDVYDIEPLPVTSALRDEGRLLLSPHAAGASREAQGRLIAAIVDNIRRAVSGEPVINVVNGLDEVIRRREA
ncbi:MAG TPA: NAD(P)-dependent oxidoreductase [Mycobacteriales bacterium]|jgi:phosphoglycerate dehydrogenase-like enzyme|nr:NAD(P)-dependent oxidoreductase [Mycobacteriales bacterium]